MLKAIALLIPIAAPLIAYLCCKRLGFWSKSGLVLMATMISLPAGFFLMLLANDRDLLSRDYINPGIGVVGIPIISVWIIVFSVVLGTIFCSFISKLYEKFKAG